jgi:LmbE family N-acetylglucosaminyl deacetylase
LTVVRTRADDLARRALGRRIAILSPHLDDAVFSLGGLIAGAARSGAEVRAVTVFGNDPDSEAPAGPWDRACGFVTVGEGAKARRLEDERACGLVGATPVWLAFADEEYGGPRDEAEIWAALADVVAWADAVFVPGFPLYHPDHAWLTEIVCRKATAARVGLYVEQPYAAWRLIGRGHRTWTLPGLTPAQGIRHALMLLFRTPAGRRLQQPVAPVVGPRWRAERWVAVRAYPRDWRAKQKAVRAYRSQLQAFGPLVPSRMALYEAAWGGEGVALLSP